MATEITQEELEQVWQRSLSEANRRGARIGGLFALTIYPFFWLLDLLVVPDRYLLPFAVIRLCVAGCGGLLLVLSRRPLFERRSVELTVILPLLAAFGICAMTAVLGGIESRYYAGLNLVMLAAGLIFTWPGKVAALAYSTMFLVFVVSGLPPVVARGTFTAQTFENLFFVGFTGIIVGIGQAFRYRLQREQVLSAYRLERTKKDLEVAHEKLKQLDRFKNQVFANITHELKTPLALILSPLELFLRGQLGPLTDSQRLTVQSMFRQGVRLLKMVQDILDLSKLEESRLRLRIAQHDLVGLVAGLVAQCRPLVERKDVALDFEPDVDACLVWCDRDQVERVLLNLLGNAAKFSPEGGKIAVSLKDRGDSVVVSVADTGPGFPEEYEERVFERFFQVEMSSTRRYGGTGIGLALCRQLVELHGGHIWARSSPGKGATFSFELPKDREHFDPEALERRSEQRDVVEGRRESDKGVMDWLRSFSERGDVKLLEVDHATERRVVERDPENGRRRHTVLVVEDNPDIIRVIHLALRQEFKVLAAEDGLKGWELAKEHVPDLVVTDLMMPGIDGLELVRRIRSDPGLKRVPVIMLTARSDMEDKLAGIESGANEYLTKPFSAAELLTKARSLVTFEESTADVLLEQKMDSLETVAAGLAHEINNPLNYLKNALSILFSDHKELTELTAKELKEGLTEKEAKKKEKIVRRIDRMRQTAEAGITRIEKVVDLMRKYAMEGYSKVRRRCDLFQAAREVVDFLLPALGKQVKVEVDLRGQGWVECVPQEVNQAISNLIQNAVEAVEEGSGKVEVKGYTDGGKVYLIVKDNGPGMTSEAQKRLFTPFFSTKEPGKGMGMGMTIVWRAVKHNDGEIHVNSSPGSGTEFVLSFAEPKPG